MSMHEDLHWMTVEMHKTAMLKDLARRAFQAQKYTDALQLYLEAFKHAAPPQVLGQEEQEADTDPLEWAILASNIAAVLLKLDRPEEALEYSKAAVEAAPDWPKALYRQAAALTALQQHSQAAQVLRQLQRLIPANSAEAAAVALKLQAALAATSATTDQLQVQAQLMATHVAWADTAAREAAGRAALLEQLQQGMSGYAWDPSDWEWRPTWTPSMRHRTTSSHSSAGTLDQRDTNITGPRTQPAVVVGSKTVGGGLPVEPLQLSTRTASGPEGIKFTSYSSTASLLDGLAAAGDDFQQQQQQQCMQLLADITKQLAELQGPKRGLALLNDNPLLLWYKRGLVEALQEQQAAAATVLVIANGGGAVLGMLAAAAGAAKVYVIEGGRWGYRAAKQLLEGNRQQQPKLVRKVELVPVPLKQCRYKCPRGDCSDTAAAAAGAAHVSIGSAEADAAAAATAAAGDNDSIDAVVQVVTAAEKDLHQQQQQLKSQQEKPGACERSSMKDDAYFYLAVQANVVVTDLLDYSVLGQGLLRSLATAAASGLIGSDATLLPHSLAIQGQLVNTHVTKRVSGFDLGPINRYRWHPTVEQVQHEQLSHFQEASTHFQLHTLDLAAHTAEHMPSNSTASHSRSSPLQHSSSASTELTADCDALLIWFSLRTKAGAVISTASHGKRTTAEICTAVRTASSRGSPKCNGCSPDCRTDDAGSCTCFGLGLYYLDNPISAASEAESAGTKQQFGQEITVTPILQHGLRLDFTVTNSRSSSGGCRWSPHGFPRHAMLPRWHFDMIADDIRNRAYDAAIRRAIAAAATADGVHVLDVGTGTGLLAMMAARAGARKVTAVESVRHLAETASNVTSLNGYSSRIQVVHKDGRYLTAGQPGRTGQCDMTRPADLLAFEVFDCGLIGEGALHIVASARANLLQPGAKILPASAKVYCQPIQYNRQTAAALTNILDPSHMHAYAWQPDYFEEDLRTPAGLETTATPDTAAPTARSTSRSVAGAMCSAALDLVCAAKPHWLPLASPQLSFEFDFNCPDPMSAFQPAVQQLQFAVDASGVCNAVAFWFELQLDEQTCLSSSPYCCLQHGPGSTWKQAVQLLPEHQVQPGQQLHMVASHDTYAISFAIAPPVTAGAYHIDGYSQSLSNPKNSSRPQAAPAAEVTVPRCHATDKAAEAVAGNSGSGAEHSPAAFADERGLSEAAAGLAGAPQPTGVPLVDPVWKAAYDGVSQLQSNLVKALTQDPLEYRKLVNAALVVAMRPWGEESTAVEEGVINTGATPSSSELDGSDAAAHACEMLEKGALAGAKRFEGDLHHAAALLVRLMS